MSADSVAAAGSEKQKALTDWLDPVVVAGCPGLRAVTAVVVELAAPGGLVELVVPVVASELVLVLEQLVPEPVLELAPVPALVPVLDFADSDHHHHPDWPLAVDHFDAAVARTSCYARFLP